MIRECPSLRRITRNKRIPDRVLDPHKYMVNKNQARRDCVKFNYFSLSNDTFSRVKRNEQE